MGLICRNIERQVSDLVAGRLSEAQSAPLWRHVQDCARCARSIEAERRMRAAWEALPAARPSLDLWPRLEGRLHAPLPARRTVFSGRLVLAGAMVTALLVGVMLNLTHSKTDSYFRNGAGGNPHITVVDEQHVVGLVAQLQQFPESNNDLTLEDSEPGRQTKRDVLIGDQNR